MLVYEPACEIAGTWLPLRTFIGGEGRTTMTFQTNLTVATLLAAGTLTLSSPPAVAQIVCNEWGECWHAHRHHEWGFNMHPYHWRWGEERRHGWHEHQGYGDWGGWHGHGWHGDDEQD
jgi:hypothetical protein